jgi:hypothetical protein
LVALRTRAYEFFSDELVYGKDLTGDMTVLLSAGLGSLTNGLGIMESLTFFISRSHCNYFLSMICRKFLSFGIHFDVYSLGFSGLAS